MFTEFFTRPNHDFTRLGRVDGWLGRTLIKIPWKFHFAHILILTNWWLQTIFHRIYLNYDEKMLMQWAAERNGHHFTKSLLKHISLKLLLWIRFNLQAVFLPSTWCKVITGSGSGLAPNRCQATTWTNDDQVFRYIFASSGMLVQFMPYNKNSMKQETMPSKPW